MKNARDEFVNTVKCDSFYVLRIEKGLEKSARFAELTAASGDDVEEPSRDMYKRRKSATQVLRRLSKTFSGESRLKRSNSIGFNHTEM